MNKPTIFFTLEKDLDDQQRTQALDQVRRISGVFEAAVIDTASALGRRMGFAELEENADIDGVLERIREVDNVESADPPAQRFLVR